MPFMYAAANNKQGNTTNPEVFACLPGVFASPFCRNADSMKSKNQMDKQLMRRAKKNDPAALCVLGGKYESKGHYSRAFECYTKAAELGDMMAHYLLSALYHSGRFVEKDEGKMLYHVEEAAIGGHTEARYDLGLYESFNENYERGVKHLIIAATQGHNDSMKVLMEMFKDGLVQKENLASVLRAHKAAVDAAKSPQRQVADDFLYGPVMERNFSG